MNPTLVELESAFLDYLHGQANNPLITRLAGIPGNQSGLEIYRHNHRENLLHLLQEVYPVCADLVGLPYFCQIANSYRQKYPSRFADLHRFGGHFSDFIASLPELQELSYLVEIAQLEWAWHRAYHAPDQPPFDFAALANASAEEQLRLRLHLAQHTHLLTSTYPILPIWQAHQDGSIYQRDLNIVPGIYHCLAYRPANGKPIVVEIGATEAAFLRYCQEGLPLAQALEHSSFPANEVGNWIECGVINQWSIDA